MKFPDKGILLDLLMGSVATLTLFLAYIMLPLVGMLPGIFVPFPAIFYALKRGRLTGIAIVAIASLVLAVVTGSSVTLLFLLQCGVISLALPSLLASGRGGARSIAYAVGMNLGVLLLLAGFYYAFQGGDLHAQVLKGIDATISQSVALYEKAGLKGEELQTARQAMAEAGGLIRQIYPALVIVGLAIIAGLNLLALRKAAARLPAAPAVGEFLWFKNPEPLVWVLITAGFAMLLPYPRVTISAFNVLIVVVSLYFVQGLAIIAHFFRRFAIPRLARLFFYLLLGLQPYLMVAVAVLGIFDIWGDFRTPKSKENL